MTVSRFRQEESSNSGVRLGARVRHRKFGEGVILNVEGSGAHAKIEVNFEQQGRKWMMAEFLEPLR